MISNKYTRTLPFKLLRTYLIKKWSWQKNFFLYNFISYPFSLKYSKSLAAEMLFWSKNGMLDKNLVSKVIR